MITDGRVPDNVGLAAGGCAAFLFSLVRIVGKHEVIRGSSLVGNRLNWRKIAIALITNFWIEF